jgi:hypothetical protein
MPIEILESRIAPAGILVVTLADSGPGSLRNAIDLANSNGDTSNDISFANGLHGTIKLKSSLPVITSSITFNVLTGAHVVIDGGNASQLFNIQGSQLAVNLSNLTLTRGSSGYGGALYVNDYQGTVKLNSCTITKCRAVGSTADSHLSGIGGAIDLQAGTLTLSATTVSGNTAIGIASSPTRLYGGNAEGGGIYVAPASTLNLVSAVVTHNSALGAKGANGAAGAAGAAGSAGVDGGGGGSGGAAQGGGIWSYGTVTTSNSTISGNIALGGKGGNGGAGGRGGSGANGGAGGGGGYSGMAFGGGIYSTGVLTLNNSTISGNIASGATGGRPGAPGAAGAHGHAGYKGFVPPASTGYGGGIHSQNSTLNLIQDTVANNTAGQGGGLFVNMDTTANLNNSTIAFNKALQPGMGGGLWAYLDYNQDPVTVISTVIARDSTSKTGPGQDLFMSMGSITASYSVVQSVSAGSVTEAVDGTVLENTNPLLGPLHQNGGQTLTCAPVALKSPLLGAGMNPDNLTRDQRGLPRMLGGTIDIGSVEIA